MYDPIQIWYEGHDYPTALPIFSDASRSRYWWRALAHVNKYIVSSRASFVLYDDVYRVSFKDGAVVRSELDALMQGMLEEEREPDVVLEYAEEIALKRRGRKTSLLHGSGDVHSIFSNENAPGDGPKAYANTAVVVAEDNDAHAALIDGYLRNASYGGVIHRYADGEETIENIEQDLSGVRSLMFLDIRLPRATGFDVLRWMKETPARRMIPVIMLSTSAAPEDVHTAYSLGANGYLLKQLDPVAFYEMIERTLKYWFRWNNMR